jgi:hypothetical protein
LLARWWDSTDLTGTLFDLLRKSATPDFTVLSGYCPAAPDSLAW